MEMLDQFQSEDDLRAFAQQAVESSVSSPIATDGAAPHVVQTTETF